MGEAFWERSRLDLSHGQLLEKARVPLLDTGFHLVGQNVDVLTDDVHDSSFLGHRRFHRREARQICVG